MLTDFFISPTALERYRSGITGPYLDSFTDWLNGQGYRRASIRRHVREIVNFGAWIKAKETSGKEINRGTLDRLLGHLSKENKIRYNCGVHRHIYQSACLFVDFLEVTGIVPRAIRPATVSQSDLLWSKFAEWMKAQRGTMNITLAKYRLPIMAMLQALGTDPVKFTAKSLRTFMLGQIKESSQEKSKNLATALRMFIRFLIARGECVVGLDHAIPTVARWRLATLPKYLPAHDVERLIESCDPASSLGARDRAILLLLARLGLRSCDVSSLKFCDIHWPEAAIIVSGKNRREAKLPLPQDVGDAILHYLQNARPHESSERVFITTKAPHVPISRSAVGRVVRRSLRHAGINAPAEGAHMLRHSAATNLLRKGVSLPAIVALLRHASIETTTVYAKVDTGLLSQIAMPWPEVLSC